MDRLRYWLINIPNIPTMLAFRVLRHAIQRDPAYAEGWQSNIAMAIYDESRRHEPPIDSVIKRTERGDFDVLLTSSREEVSTQLRKNAGELDGQFCNRAASRFMKLCFDVKTR